MAKKVDGTDIIEGAKPDAEVIAESTEKSFDDDFNYLAPNKPEEKVEEEQNKEKSTDDKASEAKSGDVSDKETEENVEKVAEKHEERTDGVAKISELQTQLSARDTEVQSIKAERDSFKNELEGLKNVQVTLEEIKANPLAFVKKYFPQLAESLNPRKIIADKLKVEFGADFRFEPSDAFIEGTKSYEYRLREEEVRDEMRTQDMRVERERVERDIKIKSQTETDIAQVMKDYNLTRDQVQKEIIDWSKTVPNNLVNIAKLRFMDAIIKRAVDKALVESKGRKNPDKLPAKGAKDIHGSSEEAPQHIKELNDEFGDI